MDEMIEERKRTNAIKKKSFMTQNIQIVWENGGKKMENGSEWKG